MRRLVLILLLLPACLGVAARDDVLLPVVRRAYAEVRLEIERGVSDGLEDGDLDRVEATLLRSDVVELAIALKSGDRSAIDLEAWRALKPWALRGVQDALDDGEIGPGVAEVLRERIQVLGLALAKLKERI